MKDSSLASKVGKRGTVVIPVKIRRRLGLEEGDLVIMEEREDGLLIRRAIALPIETYTPERKAEFLLTNTVDKKDYERACEEVRKMGLDPEDILHIKPPGVK